MKNKKHLAFVHEHECCLNNAGGCSGPLHAHHLLRPWSGTRGMGMKAGDENCVPLCMGHHTALHLRGNENEFFEEMVGSPEYGRQIAQGLWENSPAHRG